MNLMASDIQSALVCKNYGAQVSPFPLQTCFASLNSQHSCNRNGTPGLDFSSVEEKQERRYRLSYIFGVGKIVDLKTHCCGKNNAF